MPISAIVPNDASNVIWNFGHTNFSSTSLAMEGNQSKLLYLDSFGNLQWISFDSVSIAELLSYANIAAFPATGETSRLYFAQDTALFYRWTGSAYTRTDSHQLDKNGGTMSGNLSMGSNNISDIATASGTTASFTNVDTSTIRSTSSVTNLTTGSNLTCAVPFSLGTNDFLFNGTMKTTGGISIFSASSSGIQMHQPIDLNGSILKYNGNNLFDFASSKIRFYQDLNLNDKNITNIAQVHGDSFYNISGATRSFYIDAGSAYMTLTQPLNCNNQAIYNAIAVACNSLANQLNTEQMIDFSQGRVDVKKPFTTIMVTTATRPAGINGTICIDTTINKLIFYNSGWFDAMGNAV